MNQDVEKALRLCPDLPSLSGVAMQIIEMGRDPDVDIGALATTLSRDPALVSKILRVANSPLYGQRRRSENLRQAVMLLGLNATMTLALSFSLADSLRSAPVSGAMVNRVWRRSLLSAAAARQLGHALGLATVEEVFLAGLLQDIGIIALRAALPDRYAGLLAQAEDHDGLMALERQRLDCDHGEAGAWLMQHWGLPDYMSLAARASHGASVDDVPQPLRPLVDAVILSGPMADYMLQPQQPRLEALMRQAGEMLGLDRDALARMLASLEEAVPEIEALFELTLLEAHQAAALKDQARELLAARNLQLLQEATRYRLEADEYKRLHGELQEQVSRDPLTGLFNRRHLEVSLAEEFSQAREQGWPLTMGFLDLDHFKAVNDDHGHQAGDEILRAVAERLRLQLRGGDTVVRYGGEEFVVMLPGTTLRDGLSVFERIRRAIAGKTFALPNGASLAVTASIGVASLDADGQGFEDADHLLRAADRALYMAKRGGRNRLERAE